MKWNGNTISGPFRALHLMTLSAWALLLPLLDRLQNNVIFLQRQQFDSVSVCLSLSLLMVVPPFICMAMQQIPGIVRTEYRRLLHLLHVCFFLTLFLNLVFRWLSISVSLLSAGLPDYVLSVAALLFAIVLTASYHRYAGLRQMVTLSSVVLILGPAGFMTANPVKETLFNDGQTAQSGSGAALALPPAANRPAPIVMIVLDGCSGTSLMNSELAIDADRFPQLAAFSRSATWYRNATTIHCRTTYAVPAILTGCYPKEPCEPLESQYPPNLFRMLLNSGQYELTIYEPFTRLCPQELQPALPRSIMSADKSVVEQMLTLTSTLLHVYIKMSAPSELEAYCGTIPRQWFGLESAPGVPDHIHLRTGLNRFAWEHHRDSQLQRFIEGIQRPAEKVPFCFLHVVLPHDPWMYLPSGASYVPEDQVAVFPQEVWPKDEMLVNQYWRRHLLQLQFVDKAIGSLMDRLKVEELLDDALIIVMADHGMGFVPGVSRREPSSETIPEILSIPLLVKFPGQQSAVISDRNVESIDILPTITDTIGLTLPQPVDGISFRDDTIPARSRKSMRLPAGEVLAAADFPEKQTAVDRMVRTFGTGSLMSGQACRHTIPELIGRSVSELRGIPNSSLTSTISSGLRAAAADTGTGFVPCLYEGELKNVSNHEKSVQLAIALNGTILATTRTSVSSEQIGCWMAMLPESEFSDTPQQFQLYEIVDDVDSRSTEDITTAVRLPGFALAEITCQFPKDLVATDAVSQPD
jgi:hypothetical protein